MHADSIDVPSFRLLTNEAHGAGTVRNGIVGYGVGAVSGAILEPEDDNPLVMKQFDDVADVQAHGEMRVPAAGTDEYRGLFLIRTFFGQIDPQFGN